MPPPVALGSILVSLAEPWPGRHEAYDRWYETDHFYSGGVAGPGCLSGRRWVADEACKDDRPRLDRPLTDDPRAGTFLALYFLQAGMVDTWTAWAVAEVAALAAEDRMFVERDQTHVGFYAFDTATGAMEPYLALDHPFTSLVLTVTDGLPAPPRDGTLTISGVLAAMPEGAAVDAAQRETPPERRLTLAFGATEATAGPGVRFASRFVPTVPGYHA